MNLIKKIEQPLLWVVYGSLAIILLLPVFVNSSFFFPFIVPKILAFRLLVSIGLLAYLLLLVADQKYRPKLNVVVYLLFGFIVVATIASLLGGDFYTSFWGDMERSEGLILWLFGFVYMVIASSVLQTRKQWANILDVSLFAAIIVSAVAIAQVVGYERILNTTGERVASTIGNPAFLGAYMIVNLAFAWWNLHIRKTTRWTTYVYVALSLLFIYIIFASQTRGAILGLIAGVFIGLVLSGIFSKNKKVKNVVFLGVGVLVIAGIALFALKNTEFVQNNRYLKRVVTISAQERTAQTRLGTWSASWEGWASNPKNFLIGAGLENYHVVFNMHFPGVVYEDEGSVVWFDRAHSFIFDRGVTTGIIGLLLYLAFFIAPMYLYGKTALKNEDERPFAIGVIAVGIAYLVQNAFVFEAVTTYIVLFTLLAFYSSLLKSKVVKPLPLSATIVFAVVWIIAIGPVVYATTYLPGHYNQVASAANKLTRVQGADTLEGFEKIVEEFKPSLENNVYGRQEYRIQLTEYVDQVIAPVGEIVPEISDEIEYIDQQLDVQISEKPQEAKNYLLTMRHYNFTRDIYPDQVIERLDKALSYYPPLVELTPDRPHIHQEAGYTHLYKLRYYLAQEEVDQALVQQEKQEVLRYFDVTQSLSPKVVESYINYILLYLATGEVDELNQVYERMVNNNVPYQQVKYLSRITQLMIANNQVASAIPYFEAWNRLTPEVQQTWIQLALAYGVVGENEKALNTVRELEKRWPEMSAQVEAFIVDLEAGNLLDQIPN